MSSRYQKFAKLFHAIAFIVWIVGAINVLLTISENQYAYEVSFGNIVGTLIVLGLYILLGFGAYAMGVFCLDIAGLSEKYSREIYDLSQKVTAIQSDQSSMRSANRQDTSPVGMTSEEYTVVPPTPEPQKPIARGGNIICPRCQTEQRSERTCCYHCGQPFEQS